MNQNIISIGLKVIVAVASGIAVFVSIDKATKSTKGNNTNPQPQVNNGNGNFNPVPNPAPVVQQNSNNQNSNAGAAVVNSLRESQQTCNKISIFLQNLVGVTESLLNLFGKGNYVTSQPQGQVVVSGGNLVRVNPYVVAAGSVTNGNYQPIYDQNGNYPI